MAKRKNEIAVRTPGDVTRGDDRKTELAEIRRAIIEREDKARELTIREEDKRRAYMRRVLFQAAGDINDRIAGFYSRYAKAEGITLAEAHKRVSAADVRKFEAAAAKMVRERDFSEYANSALRLYNATMKINRLEMLKSEIGLVLIRSYDDLEERFSSDLLQTAKDEFERQAGILGGSAVHLTDAVTEAVTRPFAGVIWNDRLWNNEALLHADIGGLLTSGFIQGRHPWELAKILKKRVNRSLEDLEVLMVTEMCRVQPEAQKSTFLQFGYGEYEFIPERDGRTCPKCRAMDGKIYPVKDMQPGVNAPPMHPRCRCSTAAVSWGPDKKPEGLPGKRAIEGKEKTQEKVTGDDRKKLERRDRLTELKDFR